MIAADSLFATGYRYFAAVARLGSIRAASRQLNVAASAISRQISLLEANTGIALFERQSRRLALTEAGQALLKGVAEMALGNEATLARIAALKGKTRGRVRIAAVESLSVALLPALLIAFTRRFPGIQCGVSIAGSAAVADLVREREADIGFAFNPAALDGLAVEFALGVPIGAAMAPGHPLASAKSLTLPQAISHPAAWPSPDLSIRLLLDRALGSRDERVERLYECNSIRLMAALARDGGCLSLQTRFGIEPELESGALVFIPFADRRLPVNRLALVRLPGLDPAGAAAAFLDLARAELAGYEGVRKLRTPA